MKKQPTWLDNLSVNRVDLVDRGANQHAKVPLFKRDNTQDDAQQAMLHSSSPSAVSADSRNGAMSDGKIEMSEEVADFIVDLQDQLTKAREENVELQKRLDGDDSPADTSEEIFKGLDDDDPIRKAWEEDRAKVEKAEADAAAAELELVSKQFVEKAEGFEFLGDAEATGPVLQELAKAAPEAYETLESLLATAAKQVETSGLFDELGKSVVPSGNDAYEQVTAIAKGIAQSEEISEAEAMAKAWERNPELYAEYEADKRATTLR